MKHLLQPADANGSVWALSELLKDAARGVYTMVEYVPKIPKAVVAEQQKEEEEEPLPFKEAVKLPLKNEYVSHFVGKYI